MTDIVNPGASVTPNAVSGASAVPTAAPASPATTSSTVTPPQDPGQSGQQPDQGAANRRIRQLIRENKQLQERLASSEGGNRGQNDTGKPAVPAQDKKPELGEFESVDEWVAAVGAWGARQESANIESRAAQRRAEENFNQSVSAWQERVASYGAENPQFQTDLELSEVGISAMVGRGLIEAGVEGPKILHYLAKNPAETRKLNALLDERAVARAIGRIEAKLEGQTQSIKTSSQTPNEPLTGSGKGGSTVADANMSTKEWIKRDRERRGIKSNRATAV